MKDRVALNVQRDAETRRVVSEALSMFSPGFHVTSARDLDTATEWMAVLEPDLVVLGSDVDELTMIVDWLAEHDVDLGEILVIGSDRVASELGAQASIEDPLRLPDLISTVSRIVEESVGPAAAGADR